MHFYCRVLIRISAIVHHNKIEVVWVCGGFEIPYAVNFYGMSSVHAFGLYMTYHSVKMQKLMYHNYNSNTSDNADQTAD